MTTFQETCSSNSAEPAELICPKCQHLNSSTAEVCAKCQRHVQVFCGHCGHLNYRGNSRCGECRTQLHLSWPDRWKQAQARTWIRPLEIALLVVSVTLTYKGVVKLSQLEFSQKPDPPTPVFVLRPDGNRH